MRRRPKSPTTRLFTQMFIQADQRRHQSSASLAFVRGIHPWPVNSPHKWPVTWKMFPFDGVIMPAAENTYYPRNTFLWIYGYRADLHDDKWLKMDLAVVLKIVHTCLKIRNTCDFLSVIFTMIKGFQITYLPVLKYEIFMTFVSIIYTIIKRFQIIYLPSDG